MKKFLQERRAKDIMTKEVHAIEPGTSVHDIFRLFLAKKIMGAPVTDKNGKVIGIVTERDLAIREENVKVPESVSVLGSVVYLENLDTFQSLLKKKIGQLATDVMTSPVFTLPEDASLGEILNFMEEHKVNRVPIVNQKDELVGIITRTDILREIAREGKDI